MKPARTRLTRRALRNAGVLLLAVGLAISLRVLSVRHQLVRRAPLRYESFAVVFTNPECATYSYHPAITTVSNEPLLAKPKNAYCSKSDAETARRRVDGPTQRLLSWIEAADTREIFVATLTLRSELVATALCSAYRDRGVRVTVAYDVGQEPDAATLLDKCAPNGTGPKPLVLTRGQTNGLGYAHVKLVIINPNTPSEKIVFGSGNISKALDVNHENWNFVALEANTHFAAAHDCAAQAIRGHADSLTEFTTFLNGCRGAIRAAPESDIEVFFAPAEGQRAELVLLDQLRNAQEIRIAAHALTLPSLVDALRSALDRSTPPRVTLLLDSDLYWGPTRSPASRVLDAAAVAALVAKGAEARYLETNASENLSQHNKFVLTRDDRGVWNVFSGAGNFSVGAFHRNLENFYWIKIPETVNQYRAQFEHLFELATPPSRMPIRPDAPVVMRAE